jgi:hypothetical protein
MCDMENYFLLLTRERVDVLCCYENSPAWAQAATRMSAEMKIVSRAAFIAG